MFEQHTNLRMRTRDQRARSSMKKPPSQAISIDPGGWDSLTEAIFSGLAYLCNPALLLIQSFIPCSDYFDCVTNDAAYLLPD